MKKYRLFLYFLCLYVMRIFTMEQGYHHYFWANYNHFSGKKQQAHQWYNRLFSSQHSLYSYKGYIYLLADINQWKRILDLMPSLNEQFAQDVDVQIIFIQALEKNNKIKEADARCIKLSQTHTTHPDIILHAAQAYIRSKEPENAISIIATFLNNTPRRPHNFVFYFLLSQTYAQLNQLPQALETIHKCLELYPQFDKGWLLYAMLCEKEGDITKAISGYSSFVEISGPNPTIEEHVFNLMIQHKSLDTKKQFILWHTPSIHNALALFEQKKYYQALRCVDGFLVKNPNDNQGILLKAQILCATKNFNAMIQLLSQRIAKESDELLWTKTLYLATYSGMPRTQCIKAFEFLIKEHPNNIMCILYCTDLCIREGAIDQAIAHLKNALNIQLDGKILGKIAYQLALLYYQENNYPLLFSYLEKAYEYNDQCPYINNAFAYYWATKGKNIKHAYSFIEKALTIDPHNPYFLDTKALILYKEKQYEKAQEILEDILKKTHNHTNGTILLHLAKVHYALNNKEQADTLTQQAKAIVKNNHEKKALKKMQLLLAHT